MSANMVIRGGVVVDGTGAEPVRADLEVAGGVVRRIGSVRPGEGDRVVDVDGAVVAPGFIDCHSHADLAALYADDPAIHHCRLLQGVTTEIVGNCGCGPFPVPDSSRERVLSTTSSAFGARATTFGSFDDYAASMSRLPLPSNLAPLVGHGALRAAHVGSDDRPATPDELNAMTAALHAALSAGAFGISTGLAYTPGCFAPADELAALASVAAATGTLYVSHIRSITDEVFAAIEEALTTAQRGGAPLHISHLKLAGTANWGRSAQVLATLDNVNAAGGDVSTDVYPYTAGSTSLHALLPPETFSGGMADGLRRLADPAFRRLVDQQLTDGVSGWQNLGATSGWENVRVASALATPQYLGRSIAELAAALPDGSPVDAIASILAANDGRVVVVMHNMDETDLRTFLRWPQTLIGSDGIPVPGKPHPRVAGTFPRVLSRYVGEDGLESLATAINRMTGATAVRFGIPDRGVLRIGAVADIVVVDPVAVSDTATYEDPLTPPSGIQHVWLAGSPAVADGKVVDDQLGRVLRHSRPPARSEER